jgi:hypothetical protein
MTDKITSVDKNFPIRFCMRRVLYQSEHYLQKRVRLSKFAAELQSRSGYVKKR